MPVQLPVRDEAAPTQRREQRNDANERREMSPDRAWWFDVPAAPTDNHRCREQSASQEVNTRRGEDHPVTHDMNHMNEVSQDRGAGVGTLDSLMFLDTFFKSANSENHVFMTPRESRVETVNLLMLTPPRGEDEQKHDHEVRHHPALHDRHVQDPRVVHRGAERKTPRETLPRVDRPEETDHARKAHHHDRSR